MRRYRLMAGQLLPGVLLPGVIYFIVSRHASLIVALAAASCLPLLDAAVRVARRKPLSVFSLGFLLVAGVSVGLALRLRSPVFILLKGAVVSAVLGLAFAISAAVRRPLTRTLAISLSSDHPEGRRRLSERWAHPAALAVFRMLSVGWGVLLLALSVQQLLLVATVSPGLVMAIEPVVQAAATVAGIVISVAYVRRIERTNPHLGLLTTRD